MVLRRQRRPIEISPDLLQTAVRFANQQMRRDVLPLLSRRHPRPNSWNPLRAAVRGDTAFSMKLWLPDKLALEILRSEKLMEMTAQIAVDAAHAAMLAESKDFVTDLLRHELELDDRTG